MAKVFIVEDNDDIRALALYALNNAGFETDGFADGAAFFSALQSAVPELVLLDIMLPGEDGLAILRRLRGTARYESLPVIMLTARVTELDRVRGLDMGADDYITKPFSVMELVSRVKAVLRRYTAGAEGAALRVGGVTLRRDAREVFAGDTELSLTYLEFELLSCLMSNEGIAMSRERLLERVWGYDYGGESRTVDMHIKSLRQKLGEHGELIKTVRNVGYKMGGRS
jgi:two-component system alkaline phosphatase synthesis response regulator PhoP